MPQRREYWDSRPLSTPLGWMYLAASEQGLTRCVLGENPTKTHAPGDSLHTNTAHQAPELNGRIATEFPIPGMPTAARNLCNLTRSQLEEYFAGTRRSFRIPLDLSGSEFRRRIWQTCAAISYGQTRTYSQLAVEAGSPGAARAVGQAMHSNPVVIIVPCHRVVAARGLGGYGPGIEIKQWLLDWERQHGR